MSRLILLAVFAAALLLGCTAGQAPQPTATAQPTATVLTVTATPTPVVPSATATPTTATSNPTGTYTPLPVFCSGFTNFQCVEFRATSNETVVVLKNIASRSFDVIGVFIKTKELETINYQTVNHVNVPRDTTLTIDGIAPVPVDANGEYEVVLELRYREGDFGTPNAVKADNGFASGRLQ